MQQLKKTSLYKLHLQKKAKMVPFAGYSMPVQYEDGIIKESLHTRSKASLFDVSHMGQFFITHKNSVDDLLREFEKIVPSDLFSMEVGQLKYSLLTLENGGILDDLMIYRVEQGLFIVVNAACKDKDIKHLRENLSDNCLIEEYCDWSLVAFQGPQACEILSDLLNVRLDFDFLNFQTVTYNGETLYISRSGYTGEDGFEISIPNSIVEEFSSELLNKSSGKFAGLGARDILRLEAGLCLYGHDLKTDVTAVESSLKWVISKRRREEKGFLGDKVILEQFENPPLIKRIGLIIEGRLPAREGMEILDQQKNKIGVITSGGYSPTLNKPIAMGYVEGNENSFFIQVRKNIIKGQKVKMPFVPHNYYRGKEKVK